LQQGVRMLLRDRSRYCLLAPVPSQSLAKEWCAHVQGSMPIPFAHFFGQRHHWQALWGISIAVVSGICWLDQPSRANQRVVVAKGEGHFGIDLYHGVVKCAAFMHRSIRERWNWSSYETSVGIDGVHMKPVLGSMGVTGGPVKSIQMGIVWENLLRVHHCCVFSPTLVCAARECWNRMRPGSYNLHFQNQCCWYDSSHSPRWCCRRFPFVNMYRASVLSLTIVTSRLVRVAWCVAILALICWLFPGCWCRVEWMWEMPGGGVLFWCDPRPLLRSLLVGTCGMRWVFHFCFWVVLFCKVFHQVLIFLM